MKNNTNNILQALKIIFLKLDTKKFKPLAVGPILSAKKVGAPGVVAMINGGIIEAQGHNAAHRQYKWLAGNPDNAMAQLVLDEIRKYYVAQKQNSHRTKPASKAKPHGAANPLPSAPITTTPSQPQLSLNNSGLIALIEKLCISSYTVTTTEIVIKLA